MLSIAIGKYLVHKTLGPCKVVSKNSSGNSFEVVFEGEGRPRRFVISRAGSYFSPAGQIEERYRLRKTPTAEILALLEAADRGDLPEATTAVSRLDELREFDAVNAVCRRLEFLGVELDYFLLVKHAKALRRVGGERAEAVAQASRALALAHTVKERAIARTLRAAALVDLDKLVEAEAECHAAAEENPEAGHPYSVLGRIHVQRGLLGEADEYFERARALEPGGRDSVLDEYSQRVQRLAQQSRNGEVEQIREHIRNRWPPERAIPALRVISEVLGEVS